MMAIERRYLTGEVRMESDGDTGTAVVAGYAARFNQWSVDLGGFVERINPGAFDAVLGDDVRGLFNHDPNMILGRTSSGTLRLMVDEDGLGYEIDLPQTSYAHDLRQSLARGDVQESSFGFVVDRDEWREGEGGRLERTILSFRQLYDVSPVTFPAYPSTSAATRGIDLDEIRAQLAQVGTTEAEAEGADAAGRVATLRRRLELLALA